jgi:hypothetical protein
MMNGTLKLLLMTAEMYAVLYIIAYALAEVITRLSKDK